MYLCSPPKKLFTKTDDAFVVCNPFSRLLSLQTEEKPALICWIFKKKFSTVNWEAALLMQLKTWGHWEGPSPGRVTSARREGQFPGQALLPLLARTTSFTSFLSSLRPLEIGPHTFQGSWSRGDTSHCGKFVLFHSRNSIFFRCLMYWLDFRQDKWGWCH